MGRDSSSLHETRPSRHIRRSSSGLGAAAAACFTPSIGATKGGQASKWLSTQSLIGITGILHCITLTSTVGCLLYLRSDVLASRGNSAQARELSVLPFQLF